jgi:hypothetical protein
LLQEVGPERRGGRQRACADFHRGCRVEVEVDQVDRLDLGDILDAFEDLNTPR